MLDALADQNIAEREAAKETKAKNKTLLDMSNLRMTKEAFKLKYWDRSDHKLPYRHQ